MMSLGDLRQAWQILLLLIVTAATCSRAQAAAVFARFKVIEPATGDVQLTVGGFIHREPWYLPNEKLHATAGVWSEWLDVSRWPLHARMDRAGGIAEWPAMRVTVAIKDQHQRLRGCKLNVELADAASDKAVVHSFAESSESDTIAFLLPTPLREHAREFETGSQMAARHQAWAKDATGDRPIQLKSFTFITTLWGPYDPGLARQEIDTLKMLGFNIIGDDDAALLQKAGVRTFATTWNYDPSTKVMDEAWAQAMHGKYTPMPATQAPGQPAHYVLSDEVQTLDFRKTDADALNAEFRDYLRRHGVGDEQLGTSIANVRYPAAAMFEKTLPRDASLPTRRLMYYAAKFGQWWSAHQLRHGSDLIHASYPGMPVETLPSDHGFFYAWGPPHVGMSYRMLDLFELGAQHAVDQLSVEDWLGLNHMYGPHSTWTGAQSFEYFNAICRSARADAPAGPPILQRGLITVSDDKYLQLKATSAIGQGVKSLFFWTYGPTYIGTENYWSDLRSEYDGIAHVGQMLEKAEPPLDSAQPVRDPVAIVYSVSHDIWHSDNPAAFVEKRLLWHALRHLHVQPDFVREEDIEAGRLADYKMLFLTDACLTRAASAKIDQWVKDGGVLYLSAGAATRDEFYEPYVPSFAADAWPADAAAKFKLENHEYNERADLPTLHSLTTAKVQLPGTNADAFDVPVLGAMLPLRAGTNDPIAHFADGSSAGVIVNHGNGKVIALGFLPMLAYGQGAGFKPRTLEEKWPAAPRRIIQLALDSAHIMPIARCDHPVVETSLLTGSQGSVLLLANYTYEPIESLTIDLRLDHAVSKARSAQGVPIQLKKTPTGVRLHLPLQWTDAVLLEP